MNTHPKNLNSTDIARLAGVSQATVSCVVSGCDKVKEATRLRVLKVINEIGYSPNPFARAMRTSQSRTVGVAVSRITNPIVPEILKALAQNLIGFINGPLDRTTLADREAGFRHALAVSGRDIPPHLYAQSDFAPEAFRQAAIDMMASDTPPDAIACGNDLIAIGALNGLRSIGAKVPEDVRVTGFDGIEMTGWDVIDLTTMRQPIDVMAADAARALIDRIEGRYIQPKVVEYRTEFIVRGSTAHAAQ